MNTRASDIPLLQRGALADKARALFALTKPRVMSLVLFTGFAGAVAAPQVISAPRLLAALIFMALGAGGAGAMNMWYERALDGQMERTKTRPLPKGDITPSAALAFASALAAIGVGGMAVFVNALAASLLAFTIFFYIAIYTIWLKPRTVHNIVIGGAAGALPPMIGWAAASGGALSWEAFYLFLIIFLWTPPHFWALALYRVNDYHKARLPMLPNVAGAAAACRQIALYAALLLPVSLLPALHGGRGIVYAASALALSGEFLRRAGRLYQARHDEPAREQAARALFGFSLIYLFALFAALLLEEAVWGMIR